MDDYAASSSAVRAFFNERNHQAGDPAKLAAARGMLASVEHPPLRWAAGSDAVEVIAGKAAALKEGLERWRELSVSTAIVPETALV